MAFDATKPPMSAILAPSHCQSFTFPKCSRLSHFYVSHICLRDFYYYYYYYYYYICHGL